MKKNVWLSQHLSVKKLGQSDDNEREVGKG